MSDFLLDTFTGSGEIASHSPETGGAWSVWTQTNALASASAVIVSDEAGNTGSASFTYSCALKNSATPPSADYTVTFPLHCVSATRHTGVYVRAQAGVYTGYQLFIDASTSLITLNRVVGTTATALATYGYAPTAGNTDNFSFSVSGTGATVLLTVNLNGTQIISYSDTSSNRITSAGNVGIYLGGGTQLRLSSISAAEIGVSSSAISITTPISGKIVQRSGTTGSINVTGSYSGTPTSIEARLVLDGTNTAVSGFDWSTKVALPSGGAYSFSFDSVPQGGWYNVQVRHSNDTAVTATSNKVGVGALFVVDGQSSAWLWFSPTSYAGDSSLTPNSLLRIAGIQPVAWDVPAAATMNGAIACGNDLIASLSIPVGLIDGSWNGSGLTVSGSGGQWISGGAAGNAYNASAAAISAETSSVEGCIWIQGEADAANSVSQSNYYIALGQMIALRRTNVGNANLPYVIVNLARCSSGSFTDSSAQAIRAAMVQKCGDANIYRVDRHDLPMHTDGLHHTAAGYAAMGKRVARALLKALGAVSTYRGPSIASVVKVNSTTFDVNLTHDYGSDFTPTSSITGWRVTDGGTPVSVSTAVRNTASKVRLTLASAPSALPVVQYAYGVTPDITGVLKDNSALTMPLEWNAGVTAIEKLASVTLVNAGNSPQASLTGLKWAWFDGTTPDAFGAPTDQGTDESTDGSGVLTVAIGNSTKTSGQVGWLIVTNSDGNPSTVHKAFSGPVTVD